MVNVIIDGGNSLYTDTQRREKKLSEQGFHYLGMGVSGGEVGAPKGPSPMPGGSPGAWEIVAPIFQKIAAQVDNEPCCRYMGPDGAGHYVKMVHNGIEYGDMQLICEAYAILKDVAGSQMRNCTKRSAPGIEATWTVSSSRSPQTFLPRKILKPAKRSWT